MTFQKALIAIATLSVTASVAFAQRPPAAAAAKPPGYEFHLKIADDGKAFVSMASVGQNGAIGPEDLTQLVFDLPAGSDRFNKPSTAFPRVVVEPGSNATMLDLWNPITVLPRGRTEITIWVPGGLRLAVPWDDPDAPQDIKPNPLLLVVKVEENGSLTLNNEAEGTIANLQKLVDHLRRIFKDRETNGVFRERTNEVEKAVTILMPMSGRKIADLATVAAAISDAGSDRISLSMDSDEGRKEMVPVPMAPPKKPHDK